MSETNSATVARRPPELCISLAGAAVLAFAAAATWLGSALAQQTEKIPDFSLDSKSAWLMFSDNLLPPDSGPGPVTFDKRYPYVDNRDMGRMAERDVSSLAVLGHHEPDRRDIGLAHAGRQEIDFTSNDEFFPVDNVDFAGHFG